MKEEEELKARWGFIDFFLFCLFYVSEYSHSSKHLNKKPLFFNCSLRTGLTRPPLDGYVRGKYICLRLF